MDLEDAEARGNARHVLREGYKADIEQLALEMCARIRRGEFDKTYPWFEDTLENIVRKHPRVSDLPRALETITYSENRNAVETDYLEGWSEEQGGPWVKFELTIDPEFGVPWSITLPPWTAIAYYAFHRDLTERIYAILGDTPQQYVASRLGHEWKE